MMTARLGRVLLAPSAAASMPRDAAQVEVGDDEVVAGARPSCSSASSPEAPSRRRSRGRASSRWMAMPMVRSSSTTRMRGAHAAPPRPSGTLERRRAKPAAGARRSAVIAAAVRLDGALARSRGRARCRVGLSEKKGSKRRGSASAGTPGPLSATRSARAAVRAGRRRRRAAAAAARPSSASSAFSIRLTSTWRSFSRSARATTPAGSVQRRRRCRLASSRGAQRLDAPRAPARRGRPARSGTPRGARSAAAPRTWRSTRSSSSRISPACSPCGAAGLARELLRQAARRGHRVADLVRDARRQLADRRRASRRAPASARRRRCAPSSSAASSSERQLIGEGAAARSTSLVEGAAEEARAQEEVSPAAARRDDGEDAEADVGPRQRLAQAAGSSRSSTEPKYGGQRIGRRSPRPDRLDGCELEGSAHDRRAVAQDDGGARGVADAPQLRQRAPAALLHAELGRQGLQGREQLGLLVLAPPQQQVHHPAPQPALAGHEGRAQRHHGENEDQRPPGGIEAAQHGLLRHRAAPVPCCRARCRRRARSRRRSTCGARRARRWRGRCTTSYSTRPRSSRPATASTGTASTATVAPITISTASGRRSSPACSGPQAPGRARRHRSRVASTTG